MKDSVDVTALTNNDGYTALTFAASQSKLDVCECLIYHVKRQEEKYAIWVQQQDLKESEEEDGQEKKRNKNKPRKLLFSASYFNIKYKALF